MKGAYTVAGNLAQLRALLQVMEANNIPQWKMASSPDDYINKFPDHMLVGIEKDGTPVGANCSTIVAHMNYVPYVEFVASLADKRLPVVMPLNANYRARVTRDTVKVGCQSFDAERVIAIADKIRELRR